MCLALAACSNHGVHLSGYYLPFDMEGDYFVPCSNQQASYVVVGGDSTLVVARHQAMKERPPSIYIEATGIPAPVPKWAAMAEPAGAYKVVHVVTTSSQPWPEACGHG